MKGKIELDSLMNVFRNQKIEFGFSLQNIRTVFDSFNF